MAITLIGSVFPAPVALAKPAEAVSQPIATIQRQGVADGRDGSLRLMANAPPAPAIYGSFNHFGFAISTAQPFRSPFYSLYIDYDVSTPPGSMVRLDARASADGSHWTTWAIGLDRGGRATFDRAARFAQYRVTLLANADSPAIRSVRVTPASEPASYTAMQENQPVAPTWKLHATRQGMVGGRTANGHRITKHDHFVSLPSWRALSPNGTTDYVVRITYNGRSSVAPVYDVGPWNAHDDYWNEQRERYRDLPRGYPEDHAAFFDKYNGGRAEKGRVSFPTAIDIGDGVWWDDLGIKGDRAVVEVTFLWLGTDPQAAQPAPPPAPEPAPAPPAAPPAAPAAPAPKTQPAPPPAPVPESPAPAAPPAAPPAPPPAPPAAPAEIVVDDGSGSFKGQAVIKWYDGPKGCGGAGHALWTFTTPNPAESENIGRWQPALPAEGQYDIYVAIPACGGRKPNTTSARYLVQHRDGSTQVLIDQAATAGTWVLLGRFPFRNGDGGFVELRDLTGDSMRTIWFDAVKWVPAS
jgi:hypothetical protein